MIEKENVKQNSISSVNEVSKIQKDILWGLYQEHRNHARHNETLRANITNILFIASAGLITLITFDQKINWNDLPATIALIFFGIVGALMSESHTGLYLRHIQRSYSFILEIEKLFFCEELSKRNLSEIYKEADSRLSKKIGIFKHFLWLMLPIFISIVGIVLTITAFISRNQ
ncbi:MAG TPA: hypothetical protein VF571_16070 [Pyrinomonadaceae bacterium]|jgi:hypothetical protein